MNEAIKTYLKPSFLICATLLFVAASSKSLISKFTGEITKKLPIPLKKPLEEINGDGIAPYKIIEGTNRRIENHDVVEELGTEEYLQVMLEDTEAKQGSPTQYCSLFITYYTGNPDTVPHVPDECYVGSGNKQDGKEIIDLTIRTQRVADSTESDLDAKKEVFADIKISRIIFSKPGATIWDAESKFSRLYFFKVNGGFTSGKTDTRAAMGKNIFGKYSYFSKVEWEFFGSRGNQRVRPTKEQIVEASGNFLSALVPALERDHWPDWDAANAKQDTDEQQEIITENQ